LKKLAFLLLILLAPVALLADDNDQELARKLTMSGKIVPLDMLIAKTLKETGGNLLEADLETDNDRYVYGIQVLMSDGVVWEFKYNARDGGLIKKEKER